MNEPEKNIPDSPAATDLQEQVLRLQRLTNFSFIGLVVLSLTVTAFLGLQWWRMSKDLEAVRQQRAAIQDANKKENPAIQSIIGQLTAYGQSHPDYADKILIKYGVKRNDGQVPPTAPQK